MILKALLLLAAPSQAQIVPIQLQAPLSPPVVVARAAAAPGLLVPAHPLSMPGPLLFPLDVRLPQPVIAPVPVRPTREPSLKIGELRVFFDGARPLTVPEHDLERELGLR